MDWHGYFTLAWLKENHLQLINYYQANPIQMPILFFILYVVITAFSIPVATILTLFAGAVFGPTVGIIIVSLASTTGASCSFLLARNFFRQYIEKKYSKTLNIINKGVEESGALYLFSLRLMLFIPFFLVNLLMGLTSIPLPIFFITSQIGMLPATIAYVNAGRALGSINSLEDLTSPMMIISLALLGTIPLAGKYIAKKIQRIKKNKKIK